MMNPSTSFLQLLRDISEATSRRKESETDYEGLLRKIFKEGGIYDVVLQQDISKAAHADPEAKDLPIREGEKVVGRELEMEKLLLKCCKPGEGIQLSAIPVLGDCGIGKTTVARFVYEHIRVQECFEMRAWVKMDGHEFRIHHAAQQILKSAMGMSCSTDDLDELDEMVGDTLQGRRCLIVFDGVESITQDLWLHMSKHWFDFVDVGSKVLITTHSEGVANLVATEAFELKPLSQYDGWSLCRQLALISSDFEEDMTGHVVKNLEALCGYVPLLLKLVGSMKRYDDNLRHIFSMLDFSDALFQSNFDASVAILICIWALPPQLRQCLAFCAIFPKDYALDRVKIINMWAAHGLLKQSPEKNLHEIGDSYFHQLLCRSFFADIARNEYGDITEFRMPGLIHTIMRDVASIVWNGKVGVTSSVSEDADLLYLHSEGPEDVKTLILSSTLYSGGSSLEFSFLFFQEVQSLDLSCSGIRNLSDDICALTELRYLNLSYTLIETLPDSITDLSQLRTLDVSWCYHFKVLPKAIRNLTYMSHLDLSQCKSLSYLPSGIGFLTSLTSMPLFVLGKDRDIARLGELEQLNELRGKLEIRNLENVMKISDARNAKLNQKNLHHLVLCWSKNVGDCFEILELLQPNQRLKVLELTGYMGSSFPRWISSISNLIKISITDCGCKELPSLGQLPFLKELQLNRMMNLECIGQEFYGAGVSDVFFPSLEQLELYDLPRLLKWTGSRVSRLPDLSRLCCSGVTALYDFSNSVFRSLKTLTVEGCPELPNLPSLPTLPNLILKSSSETIIHSLTSFTSLSSLLISDMELGSGVYFGDLGRWDSLKKLVLCNIRDRTISFYKQKSLAALEHLAILHCHELTNLSLKLFPSLKKLHIVDCPNLSGILVEEEEENTQLMELVVEDCPQANTNISFHKFHYLRKLILKNCGGDFSTGHAGEFKKLEKLEYLSITGCLKLVREFLVFPWLISHIPCIIVGNHKVNFKDSNNLREVLISASNELKSEVTVPPRDGFSHGPQKSITDQSIQNVVEIKYKEITKATKNFRPDMLLEKGSFGTVFKGWIHEHNLTAVKPGSGIAVAVKKFSPEVREWYEELWSNEMKYLSRLRHPNLVKLIGYCIKKEERILVFEFMPRGSLYSHLSTEGHHCLPWATRINVAIGAARGLSFLHELERPVIHRDVKSRNILLDGMVLLVT
ncbi:hypothetical protein ACS0TY_026229 [Phlomoides rotata]